MDKKYSIAVVGATGAVGREILEILSERNFPIKKIYLLASERSEGSKINFDSQEIEVENLINFDFSKAQIAFFSPGASISSQYVPKASEKGCISIDNTSYYRMEKDVPLIIPEVNGFVLDDYFSSNNRRNIISNPNCSTIQMLMALKPLHDNSIINRIVVSTYQSVSGKGKNGMDELFEQTRGVYANKPISKDVFTKQIAFNVIPHCDDFLENGNTKEEQKMIDETKKILDPNIEVVATCVRVPVLISHSEAINIEFDKKITEEEAKKLLENFEGISVIDHRKDEGYVTPVETAGDDLVYISRIRKDPTIDNGLNIWVVSDNLRKGAALNAIQIAELIISKDYISPS